MKKLVLWFLVGVLAVCSPLYIHAEEAPAGMGDTADVHTVTTQHTAVIDGEELAYTAVTGSYTLTSGGSQCELYFTAYTKDGVEDMASRPVTFAFNGGPGSASVWLHMGILGPRRVNLDETGKPRSLPARLTDNAYSILDMTDIVMIEPVGTGYSHALEGYDEKDFLGYENDNRTVGDFIRLYVNRNARWSSPKYLVGESYGTVRAVGVCDYLCQVPSTQGYWA